MPKVSVIIPTYNRAELVCKAIQSVLEQTYRDFEVLVIDDGSTDNTAELVKQFGPPVIYIYQENKGRSAARNLGISSAAGEFIAFLDDDDIFLPHKLEIQVFILDRQPEIGLVYTSAINIDENGNELDFRYEAAYSGWLYNQIAFYIPLVLILPTVMMRAKIFNEIGGFDVSMERFEDTDMWRRVAKRYPIQGLWQPSCKVLTHSGNTLFNLNPEKIFEQVKLYVEKIFREDTDISINLRNRLAANFFSHYGCAIYQNHEWRKIARLFFKSALKYKLVHIEALVHLIDSYFGGYLIKFLKRIKKRNNDN